MRSSEDSADDEFVFVTNREVKVQVRQAEPPPRRVTGRLHRHHHHHHPRLNQPIPTTLHLDPQPPPGLHGAGAGLPSTTTTARAKVTPLPPELIELLPPHLRENTIPDYPATVHPDDVETFPGRLAPPPADFQDDAYCSGDAPHTATAATAASPHSFDYLSELVSSSDAFSSTSDDASSCQTHTRASSLPIQQSGRSPSSTGASHTAPPTLTLTDSGISSAGSSSISSRSSSSKSLPRESVRAPRASFRNVGMVSVAAGSAFTPTKVSNTAAVSTSGEGRVLGRGRPVARTPSPMFTTCRTSTNTQEGMGEALYHAKHTMMTQGVHLPPQGSEYWERQQLNTVTPGGVGSAFVPAARHRTKQSPAPDTMHHLHRDDSPTRVEVSAGSGVAFYNAHRRASPSPSRAPPACCTPPPPQPVCRHARPSPPPSPEMRRAWNVVGVPVSCGGHTGRTSPVGGIPHTSPGRASHYRLAVSQSDPNAIYDNIMTRHSPLPATPPCRLVHSPALGKPPSPPQQRRASRSPSPGQGWASVSRSGSPVCTPCHHHAPNVQHGGCWMPVWGSSPQLYPEDGSHGCPGYVYRSSPCGVMCAATRSHSCDRLPPSHPSPPPSPVCGRRSPSPWRGGSVPPVNHRQSPSPDRASGRPPRPRRPSHRKAKTVEVGYLGSATNLAAPAHASVSRRSLSPAAAPHHGVTRRSPSPAAATPMYMSASAIMSGTTPTHTHQPAWDHHHHHHHTNTPRQLATHYQDGAPLYQNVLSNGDHVSVSGQATPPPTRCPSTQPGKQELNNGAKQKVTYKTSIYKCMKSLLLKPMTH